MGTARASRVVVDPAELRLRSESPLKCLFEAILFHRRGAGRNTLGAPPPQIELSRRR
jgi:hypothetical protein